jgi:CBS domain-containing protein
MQRELTVARPELSARQACSLMLREKLGCLPVVNDEGDLVGLVTEADFAQLALRVLEAAPQ